MVHQAPADALTNPLGGIGGKPQLPGVVKLLGRHNEADVSLLNEVHQRYPPSCVLLGHSHHQAEVALDHPPDGSLVPGGATLCQLPLLLRREAGVLANFPEICPQLVLSRGACLCLASLWYLGQHLFCQISHKYSLHAA